MKRSILFFFFLISNFSIYAQQPILSINSGHTDRIISLNYSSDGKYIVTGSVDKTLRLWDAATGIEIKSYKFENQAPISSLSFVLNDRFVLFATDKLQLWDYEKEVIARTYSEISYSQSFAVSEDKNKAIVASSIDIILIDLKFGGILKKFKKRWRDVNSITFSNDNKSIAYGGADSLVHVIDLETTVETVIKGSTDEITSVKFSPDDSSIVIGGKDQTVRIVDVNSGKIKQVLREHSGDIIAIHFNNDGSKLLTADKEHIFLWETSTFTLKKVFANTHGPTTARFTPDENEIVAVNHDKTIAFWNLQTGVQTKTYSGSNATITSLDITKDGKRIAFGGTDKSVQILDIYHGNQIAFIDQSNGEITSSFKNIADKISDVYYVGNHKLLIHYANDTISIFDYNANKSLATIYLFSDGNDMLVASSDNRYDGTGNAEDFVYLLDKNSLNTTKSELLKYKSPGLLEKILGL